MSLALVCVLVDKELPWKRKQQDVQRDLRGLAHWTGCSAGTARGCRCGRRAIDISRLSWTERRIRPCGQTVSGTGRTRMVRRDLLRGFVAVCGLRALGLPAFGAEIVELKKSKAEWRKLLP